MDAFIPGALLPTGAPRLIPSEVTLAVASPATLPTTSAGTLYVTTHRLFWASSTLTTSLFTPLAPLSTHPTPVTDASRFNRARLHLSLGHGVAITFANDRAGRASRDRVSAAITSALARRAWAAPPPPRAAPPPPPRTGAARVGIGGAVAAARDAAAARELVVGEGFASLGALEARAAELVALAARFRTLKAEPGDAQHSRLLDMMADMCIDSPVTREAAGKDTALFRRELARELGAHLVKPVVAVGGVMTTADAYFLLNRARATNEYVSPDDFMGALRGVGGGLALCELASGVRALRVDMAAAPGGLDGVAAMVDGGGRSSVSALELMHERGVPVQTALALLEAAEARGLLARDESTAGVRFFRNKFDAFVEAGEMARASVPA